MTAKAAILLACLVFTVCSMHTVESHAQATRPVTKAPQPAPTLTTGPVAQPAVVGTNEANGSGESIRSNAPSPRVARRPSEKNQLVKAHRAELIEWLQANPEGKYTLDPTERELYRNNEWAKLYDYRLNKMQNN